jgi:hypothetical protein
MRKRLAALIAALMLLALVFAVPNGDQRAFLLIRNPSVPLASGPASAPGLPATGLMDNSAAAVMARHAAQRGGLAAAIRQLRQEAAFQRHA